MCLHNVDNRLQEPRAEGTGFKVMLSRYRPNMEPKELMPGWWTGGVFEWAAKQGKEYEAKGKSKGKGKENYIRGFHILKTLKAAQIWQMGCVTDTTVIVKVTWRHRLAEGSYGWSVRVPNTVFPYDQYRTRQYKCVVAKYMTVVGAVEMP